MEGGVWRDGGGGRGAELCENFSTKDLRGCIALGILHSPPITAGEEKHITTAHQLHQIVVEITSLLSILKDKQQATRALGGQTAKEHRGTGAQQTIVFPTPLPVPTLAATVRIILLILVYSSRIVCKITKKATE